jgi:pimeloyl-ACP methyl ester carboxylesterase/heat shock protein HslJ
MRKSVLFVLLILSLLLAACSGGGITATVEPSAVAPEATSLAVPTTVPSPTVEAPTPALPPDEALVRLQANPWQWASFTNPVEQYAIDNPQNYVLTFNEDGSVNIIADCNNAAGSYTTDGQSITIQVGPMTMAACPPESRSEQFVKYLGFAAIYFFRDGNLYIDLMADGGTLAFSPAGEAGMAEPGESIQAGNLPRFEPLEECFAAPPEDLDIEFDKECGYVVVPEFYNGESTRELKLGVTRLNSGNGTAASPLFMLAGGPGQAHIQPNLFLLFQPELIGRILDDRDIVILEQRGTEHTDTFLDCPEFYSAPWAAYEQGLTPEEVAAFETGLIEKCIDEFKAQGINFDAYNSVENAADVNAVREALGYDQIIYYGASYGSQLGQHVMRDFPGILEAVVLDGANALSRKSWVEDRALDAKWGIENLTKLCEADAKCREAYDIPALVEASLALFDDGPVPYTFTDPNDATRVVEGEITTQDMVEWIYEQQGSKYSVFGLPYMLDQLTQGGAEAVQQYLGGEKGSKLIASRDATNGGLAFLMHIAMVCSDDPVHSVEEVITAGVSEYPKRFGEGLAQEYSALCALINVKELPNSTDVNVALDIPTLLLTGDLDVQTPAFRSQLVADSLPNATLIMLPGSTHVQIGGANRCAAQVMTQFVLDPTAELDTSCTELSPVLGFILPDGSVSK